MPEAEAEGEQPPSDSRNGTWLSYAELASIRGIGRESAVKLVQRERWRRVRGNDGTARVLVPPDWLHPANRKSPEHSPEGSGELSGEDTRAESTIIRVLEADLRREREIADEARERAAKLEEAMRQVTLDLAQAYRQLAELQTQGGSRSPVSYVDLAVHLWRRLTGS